MKQVNHKGWQFLSNKEGTIIQSRLLNYYGIKHGFFSKFNNSNPNYLLDFIDKDCSIHFTKQVHGNTIVKASQSTAGSSKDADSIVSDKNGQSLWVYTADCIPILFADKRKGNVAATHAGWKGLSKNIIRATIRDLKLSGSNIDDLIVALGPAISSKFYQVSIEIIEELIMSFKLKEKYEEESLVNYLYDIGVIKDDKEKNKFRLDIRLLAKEKIQIEGIKKENISVNKNCTFKESSLFNSWRRDKIKSRQWSGILSKTIKEKNN